VDKSYELSELEAFGAMILFLNKYYERSGDDLVSILADTLVQENGLPADPATWEAWRQAVKLTKGS
jgi:hypothetical protein